VSRDERGFVTPAVLLAVGFTLVLLVMAAQLLAVHYARGVLQAAVEEGARQGVAAGVAACQDRVTSLVDGLGAMGDGIGPVDCQVQDSGAAVRLTATFDGWLPGTPAQQAEVVGRAATLSVP
jgi:hypothetical protein